MKSRKERKAEEAKMTHCPDQPKIADNPFSVQEKIGPFKPVPAIEGGDNVNILNTKGQYDFFTACDLMLTGKRMRSAAWPNPKDYAYMWCINDDGTPYVGVSDPEKNRLMIHRENVEGVTGFFISEVDLVAVDWEVLG